MADDPKKPALKVEPKVESIKEASVPEHKFVMLHTQVGPYPQGQVVPASQCADWDLLRLKETGAIRDAKPEEYQMEKVAILVHPSVGMEKDSLIDKLTAERNRLSEQNERLVRELDITRQIKTPPTPPNTVKLNEILQANAEKDITIATLQNQINDLKTRLASGGGNPNPSE